MTETRASLRNLGTSPYKVREVLGLIRGLDVEAARRVLQFCERDAATDVLKLLDSAVANAEHNDNLVADELYIVRTYANEGPTAKRWRPRARGRGTQIRKRTCHVTIILARYSDEELVVRARREQSAEASGRKTRTPIRRRRRVAVPDHDHDHDGHDHDHDHDHVDEHEAPEVIDEAETPVAEETVPVAEATPAEERE